MMQPCQVPRLALGVMMVLFAASAYGSNDCTQEKIAECSTMMGNMTDGADILTKSNAEQMRTLCRNYGKFETCIAPLKTTCSTTQMNQIEAFDRIFSFLCEKKNLDDYVKHADCFSNMNVENTTATCTRILQSDSKAAKGSKARLCQINGDYVNCVVKPISSECGDEAARYMRSMLVHFLKPSLDLIDCDISAYGSNECTYEKIAECFTMLGNLTDGVDILTKSKAEQMRILCRNYGKFETCIAPLMTTCSTTQMNQIEAFDRIFSFSCEKKNLDDYVKYADCVSKMENITAPCPNIFGNDTKAAKGNETNLCQNIGDYLNCVVKRVTSECGDDAARYMRRMFVNFKKPYLDLNDCDISAYESNECTQEKIAECSTMTGNLTDGVDILTKSNAEQMRTLCSNYDKFETCIALLKPNCSETQINGIEAFARVFSYLCEKKNLDDYVKHADCFSKINMEKSTATCKTTFQSDTKAAKGSKTRLCQINGDYVNCVVKRVTSKCGDDAARYIRSMLVHFLKPSLDSTDCEISGGTSRVGTSVMVTVLAVLVLPVLTLLGV